MKLYTMELRAIITKRNVFFILVGLISFLLAYTLDRYYIFGQKDNVLIRPLELIFHPQ